MKHAPTLIDTLYRASFSNETVVGWRNNAEMRAAFQGARRFILDDSMSTFLGELATASFAKRNIGNKLRCRMVDQLRVSARLPHKSIWIEYNLRKCQSRSHGLLGREFIPDAAPACEGVLLQQHPSLETAILMHLFADQGYDDRKGSRYYTFPVAYGWTVNEEQSPWPSGFIKSTENAPSDSEVATGITDYKTPCMTITARSPLLIIPGEEISDAVKNLVVEWMGCIRRIWALLATLNDIPSQIVDVRQAKGFVARGRYRQFLDHKVLTLHVPQAAYTKIARNLIAMARKRAHQVRGHWRMDWRNPGARLCQHAWQADQTCSMCRAHRLWIHEHQRGDASLGFVTHDYKVTHDTEQPEA